jgi:hypothetical protein
LRANTDFCATSAIDRQAEADRAFDGALVQHRQHAGKARSTALACVFGSAPNAVELPEKILD